VQETFFGFLLCKGFVNLKNEQKFFRFGFFSQTFKFKFNYHSLKSMAG